MRNRCVGLRELLVATTAFLLVLSACSGDEDSVQTTSTTSTTVAAAPVSSTTAPPSPSVTTTTTSTVAPVVSVAGIGETVLVTADDGVYQIGPEGDVTLLVSGPVAYAVDDTQGGLLFQVDRGRNWDEETEWSTIVWWIPGGASRPQELLVPTPGANHWLSLHDAYATDDGFAVLYSRHEGSPPAVDDMIDRLRRFDVPARQVIDLYAQGAWEQGYGDVSTNGELIAGVWFQQIGSGCFIFDLDGQPTGLVPGEASDPTSEDYVRGCRLSPDGQHLAFSVAEFQDNDLQPPVLRLWDLIADTGTTTFIVPGSVGALRDIDLSATRALATFGDHNSQQTLVFDLNAPESDPVALPIAGRARFVDTPTDIAVPVQVGDGPSYYRYGDDGLYRVVEGVETQLETQPIIWAMDDLMGGVVFRRPYDVSSDVLWLGAGAADPELLPVEGVWDASLVDGRPVLVASLSDPEWEVCPDYDFGGPVVLHDLVADEQTFLFCHEEGPDGGRWFTSLGGNLLVGVEWAMSTDRRLVFQDLSGNEVTVGANPVPEPCLPCHLGVEISDDGALLAYSLWPTAFWPLPAVDYESAYETWRATAENVPVEVAVVDMSSGRELWNKKLDPGVRLADFDGRYLVVGPSYAVDFGAKGSVVYDTWGVHEPVEVDGDVALIRQTPNLVLRHDGLGVVSFGDPVDDVMAVLTELLGPPDVVESQNSPEVDVSVQWNHPFLYLQFTFWDYFDAAPQPPEPMPAGPVFHYYLAKSDAYSTEAGIAVGDTVYDLRSAYPSVQLFDEDCGFSQGTFLIDPPEGWLQLPIWGLLSGEPATDDTTIVYIGAGWDRSPC
ncbi:MAG: hypothetical protein QNJ89_00285 [Acidimicrobiia bacterium]|nr:hypothetical protein [Acidimicrobiia bacterium]